MSSPEEIITCPYNKAHSIISNRMQFHLTRCRAQHPYAEKTICPFNSTHIINKIELDVHQRICEDRIVLDSFISKLGANSKPHVTIKENESINFDEDWNNELLDESVLENVKKDSLNKPALTVLIGAPKSERKAHRFYERLRIQRVLDEKVNEEKNKSEKKSNGKKKNSLKTKSPIDANMTPKTSSEETQEISDEYYIPSDKEAKKMSTSEKEIAILSSDLASGNDVNVDQASENLHKPEVTSNSKRVEILKVCINNEIENSSLKAKAGENLHKLPVTRNSKQVEIQKVCKNNEFENSSLKDKISQAKGDSLENKTSTSNSVSPSKICNMRLCLPPNKAVSKMEVAITVAKDRKRSIFSPWKTISTSACPQSHIENEDDFPALTNTGRARGGRT